MSLLKLGTAWILTLVALVAVQWVSAVYATDFHPIFSGQQIASIEIKKGEDEKVDTATVKTKSGRCFQFQMQKGKVLNWKDCKDANWHEGDAPNNLGK